MSTQTPQPVQTQPSSRPKKFLDQVREKARLAHFSYRTEQAYVHWVRRFVVFHHLRHPSEMGPSEITR